MNELRALLRENCAPTRFRWTRLISGPSTKDLTILPGFPLPIGPRELVFQSVALSETAWNYMINTLEQISCRLVETVAVVMKMGVGERIREIRKAKKISQEQLAARLKMTRANVSKLESGAKVDADLLPVIAEVLSVSAAAFFGEGKSPKLAPSAEQVARRSADLALEAARDLIRKEIRDAVADRDLFAPASFRELPDSEKLPRPPFEQMPSGQALGKEDLARIFAREMVQVWDRLSEEHQRRIWRVLEEVETTEESN